MTTPDLKPLRVALDDVLRAASPTDPVEAARQRTLVAAILCEACRRVGLTATLVGGGAIEFHAPGAYATADTDLVVVGPAGTDPREAAASVFRELGFSQRGRHWERAGQFVELPGVTLDEPVEEHRLGEYLLRVVRPEVVLADRIVGFKHWRYTAYGLQALAMLAAFGDAIEEGWLLERLEREAAVDAYHALRRLAASSQRINDAALRKLLDTLPRPAKPSRRARPPGRRSKRQ